MKTKYLTALIVSFIGFITAMMFIMTRPPVVVTKYADDEFIDAHLKYYFCTEKMLDSIGASCTDPVFETPCGQDYLEAKYTLDSLLFE